MRKIPFGLSETTKSVTETESSYGLVSEEQSGGAEATPPPSENAEPQSLFGSLRERLAVKPKLNTPQPEAEAETEAVTENTEESETNAAGEERSETEPAEKKELETETATFEDVKTETARMLLKDFGIGAEEFAAILVKGTNMLRKWLMPKAYDKAMAFTEAEQLALDAARAKRDKLEDEGKTETEVSKALTPRDKRLLKLHDKLQERKAEIGYTDDEIKRLSELVAKEMLADLEVPEFWKNKSWLVLLIMIEGKRVGSVAALRMEKQFTLK